MEYEDKIRIREKMKLRLKQFVLNVIKLSQKLPKTEEFFVSKKQILRSASSVYTNYRAAYRVRSKAEFFSILSLPFFIPSINQ